MSDSTVKKNQIIESLTVGGETHHWVYNAPEDDSFEGEMIALELYRALADWIRPQNFKSGMLSIPDTTCLWVFAGARGLSDKSPCFYGVRQRKGIDSDIYTWTRYPYTVSGLLKAADTAESERDLIMDMLRPKKEDINEILGKAAEIISKPRPRMPKFESYEEFMEALSPESELYKYEAILAEFEEFMRWFVTGYMQLFPRKTTQMFSGLIRFAEE